MASVSNATSLGLKTQSNTTSKISHALEVLKKFDNKYKIKPSGVPNTPKLIDVINTSTDISDKSKQDKPQEGLSHMYTPESAQIGLYAGTTSTSTRPSGDKHNIKIKSPDRPRTYNGIRKPDSIPKVVTVTGLDEGEDYESDFELSDSESLNVESDAAKEIDSSGESKPGSRRRFNLHSSETESSIHTIPDQDDSKSIENVGVFRNMRLFTFSDLDSKVVNKIDELIVPVTLKDSTTLIGKPDAGAIKKVNSISNNNFERNLEIQIPLNVGIGEKGANSSDYESIPESLSNSSVSDDSCIGQPIRRNIFMMDDLNGADLVQPIQVTLPSHIKVAAQETQNVAISGGILFTLEEDIEEVIEDNSDNKTEQHILTDGSILSDPNYESDYLSESDINPKQESSGKSLKSNSSLKSTRINRPVDTLNKYVPITHLLEDPHTKTNDRKYHLMTRNVSVQTELLEKGRHSPRVRSSQTQVVFEPLNLSWDFDKEEDNGKSARPFILHHQILTPEVVEALATQKPAEDALDQVVKQQISLTKHFMASQYKMYQTYCMSVRQLTNEYTPITLEETKEFIKMHCKKMRANRNDQQVFT